MKTYNTRVELINAIRSHVNKVAPLAIAQLAKGFKQKNNHGLHKKDDEALRAIVDAPLNNIITVYIRAESYSISILVKGHYPTGDYGCAYIEEYVYLWDASANSPVDFTPREPITQERYDEAVIKRAAMRQHIVKLTQEKSMLTTTMELPR